MQHIRRLLAQSFVRTDGLSKKVEHTKRTRKHNHERVSKRHARTSQTFMRRHNKVFLAQLYSIWRGLWCPCFLSAGESDIFSLLLSIEDGSEACYYQVHTGDSDGECCGR